MFLAREVSMREWSLWRRWRARWTARWAARTRRNLKIPMESFGRTRMDDRIEAGVQQALARVVLQNGSPELHQVLLDEVWRQREGELTTRALAQVREAHQHELRASEEALRDRYARERKALERELEGELDRRWQAEQRRLDEDMGERLARLRTTREGWKARAEAAEAQLVFLLEQLLSEERKR